MRKTYTFCGIVILMIISCAQQLKFDRENWLVKTDLNQYPYRESMLPDLVNNQKLQGKRYSDIISMLGTPEAGLVERPREMYYLITPGNTAGFDPVSPKYLVIYLTPDSTVTNYKVVQWMK